MDKLADVALGFEKNSKIIMMCIFSASHLYRRKCVMFITKGLPN